MRMTKLALIAVVATGVVSAGLSTVEHLDNEIVELDEAAFEVFETASYATHHQEIAKASSARLPQRITNGRTTL
jgi:hypothetical protein